MNMKVFSVYDLKAQVYATPFFMNSNGAAVRGFADMVNDPQTYPSKHPSDYILFEIGSFDDSTCKLESLKEPVHLGLGSDFVEKRVPSPVSRFIEKAVSEPLSTSAELNGDSHGS